MSKECPFFPPRGEGQGEGNAVTASPRHFFSNRGGAMRRLSRIFFAGLLALASIAQAQEYPSRPIRLIVAFAPGGVVDTAARVLSTKMTERLGWQFVVDNRTGGNGLIGGNIAAKAPADGYTILLAHTGEFAINQWIFK